MLVRRGSCHRRSGRATFRLSMCYPPANQAPAAPSRRLRLTLAYDGRPFHGWQTRGDGTSIQEHVEKAVRRILKSPILVPVIASGRTDAGVHALAKPLILPCPQAGECRATMGTGFEHVATAANPGYGSGRGGRGFPCPLQRFGQALPLSALQRPLLAPFDFGHVGHWPWPLDREAMAAAAPLLVGRHDFSAFAAFRHDGTDADPESGRNIRHLWRADLAFDGPWIVFDFAGTGFSTGWCACWLAP
jgi:tRNA pseudouridine38-40 synthase